MCWSAALDTGQAQMFAVTLPAYRRTKEWPAAVRVSLEAMLDFLAAHPDFAQLALVEILSCDDEGAGASRPL